ncbi:MAG: carbohydrate-binding family 9-like protein [Candidatus Omnitrophica bacterium]|nr:carbohydrate-binding family 9-like protein [Candidatus Omnitrophota bacterium]
MSKNVWISGVLCFVLFSGCALTPKKTQKEKVVAEPVPLVAIYSETPVVVDGKLEDPVWSYTPVYNLSLSKEEEAKGTIFQEKGEVRAAWDKNYLYIGIKFYDSDIVQEETEDQKHFYRTGDLVEIFLKPEESTWYWEIYGTPNSKKTVFWFPGRGRIGLPSGFEPEVELKDMLIGVQIKGTLNKWEDRDDYWTLEIAIPTRELTRYGDTFGPGSEWRVLIARYNYSRYLSWKELSMYPKISLTNYHLIEEYGKLILETKILHESNSTK